MKGWDGFVAKLAKERPSISTALEHSIPTKIESNQLTVYVSGLPEFSVNNLNMNSQIIEIFLEDFFDINLKFKAKLDSTSAKKEIKPPQVNKESTNTEENRDNILGKILDNFDGEILR